MFRNLVLLNAFYLYASVTVYMAVIGAAAPVYGKAALAELNLFGVIVGKAIYEGRVTLKELERFQVRN